MTEPGRFLSFEAVADDYDRTRVMPQAILDDVARACAREARLDRPGGGPFLDAGVGTGRFAAPLARLHPGRVVGLDVSPAMLAQARAKAPALPLAVGDLQRLPLRTGSVAGALVVHILHLVEQWRRVLDELRRALVPKAGVLLLGGEQGSRSALVDFYFERARARGVLAESLGTPGLTQALAHLRRSTPGAPPARIQLLSLPYLKWKRAAPVAETLDALARRTYSQTWDVPDAAHAALLAETQEYAARAFPNHGASETLDTRFVLHTARWPG